MTTQNQTTTPGPRWYTIKTLIKHLGYVPIQNIVGKAVIVLISIDLTHPWPQFWYWPQEIRWNRILHPIQ